MMVAFEDKRMLTALVVTPKSQVLFEDELSELYDRGEYIGKRNVVDALDVEQTIYNVTKQAGGKLPPKGSAEREVIRAIFARQCGLKMPLL